MGFPWLPPGGTARDGYKGRSKIRLGAKTARLLQNNSILQAQTRALSATRRQHTLLWLPWTCMSEGLRVERYGITSCPLATLSELHLYGLLRVSEDITGSAVLGSQYYHLTASQAGCMRHPGHFREQPGMKVLTSPLYTYVYRAYI